ncbi:MAG: bifunctional riboflavin kinase/FAD synthetase [Bacteroidetes bacterium]|nr:bifunctional riboflavin kinase/FAD synthetase [Bacteroidota bacterium]
MKVTYGIENIVSVAHTVSTLGSYDGLHLGHRDILQVLKHKRDSGGHARAVVLTFDPHPQEVLRRNDTTVNLLTTIDERLALLAETGIDETVVIKFDRQFSQTPYADFFREVIVEGLGTDAMVVGFNHAFGKNREGDIAHLEQLGAASGVEITEVPPHIVDGVQISSTKIRHALQEGDVQTAHLFLGRPYAVRGVVVDGNKIGRTLGYPTANLSIAPNKLVPKDGVYAATARLSSGTVRAAVSIGMRPTIGDGLARVVEALLLDFDGDLYGATLELQLLQHIREQIAFATLDELKAKITEDVTTVRSLVTL